MRTDHLGHGFELLDPESRALLELSVVRELPDEELAGMLGIEVGRLRARRERVMRELGANSAQEREALSVSLRMGARQAQREDVAQTKPAAEARPAGEPAPTVAAQPRQSRRALLALASGVTIAIVVAIAFALAGDDPPVFPEDRGSAGPDAPRAERFEAVRGGEGDGTARITGAEDRKVLHISVRGLPRPAEGGYVVWLYDSISKARPLTGSRRGTFTLRQPLPPGFARYGFLDVSRELADGNLEHSGRSVLRVPLEQIPGT